MSLAMRQARYSAVGDPGLFGFIGKALGTVAKIGGAIVPGIGGTVLKTVGNVLVPTKSVSMAKATAAQSLPVLRSSNTQPYFAGLPSSPPVLKAGSGVSIGPGGVQIGSYAPQLPAQSGTSGALVGSGAGTPCTAGYHYNKTAYYTKRYGVVEKGSVCVKNRRRNPLNPRALSRAMSRVKSAQKAVKCLQLFAGPAARASSKGGGKVKRRAGCNGKCR